MLQNRIKQHSQAFWVIALAAPTRVSPAPATEQKQHHQNNQYGFHCCTSLVRGSWTDLCNGHLNFFTTPHATSGEDARLSTLDHFNLSIRTVCLSQINCQNCALWIGQAILSKPCLLYTSTSPRWILPLEGSPGWRRSSVGSIRTWVLCHPTGSYELLRTAD